MGRPKKKDAVKPGELKDGLQRFTFIAESSQIKALRDLSKERGEPIMVIMKKALKAVLPKQRKMGRPRKANVDKVSPYLKDSTYPGAVAKGGTREGGDRKPWWR